MVWGPWRLGDCASWPRQLFSGPKTQSHTDQPSLPNRVAVSFGPSLGTPHFQRLVQSAAVAWRIQACCEIPLLFPSSLEDRPSWSTNISRYFKWVTTKTISFHQATNGDKTRTPTSRINIVDYSWTGLPKFLFTHYPTAPWPISKANRDPTSPLLSRSSMRWYCHPDVSDLTLLIC